MTGISNSLIYWNYFLALESDLHDISRYIEFSEDNFNTYSIELAHLFLASFSEIDVVAKELCRLLNPNSKCRNIDDYKNIIKGSLPELITEPAFITRYGITVKPWDSWENEINPHWWKSYNNVKHERNMFFKEASLINTLNSLGALLIIEYYLSDLNVNQSNRKKLQENYSQNLIFYN